MKEILFKPDEVKMIKQALSSHYGCEEKFRVVSPRTTPFIFRMERLRRPHIPQSHNPYSHFHRDDPYLTHLCFYGKR